LDLNHKRCVPCEGGAPALTLERAKELMKQVAGWDLDEKNRRIQRKYHFKDFKEAMVFVNRVADLAEDEGHHPDIHIHYNEVTLVLWTHAVGGLSENDFILAAKVAPENE
jgi:4a-hydroxytetrahydrobiopterin dehydratase